MNGLPKVSIIFSNLNGGIQPIECLNSIKKLNYPKNKIETIVIDNASIDSSPQKITKKFPNVKLVKLKKAIGLPASLNLGIKKSTGEYIFIANDDIILEKESIKVMVQYIKKHHQVGILTGKVFYKDLPNKLTNFAPAFNFYLGSIKKRNSRSKIIWLQSCALMIPKRVFEEIGLFDESFYPLYFDDFDLCLRATKAGFKLSILSSAIFWHGYGKTIEKVPLSNKHYWWYRNKIRFIIKHGSKVQIFTVVAIQIASVITKIILLKKNDFIPLVKALRDNLKMLSKTDKKAPAWQKTL